VGGIDALFVAAVTRVLVMLGPSAEDATRGRAPADASGGLPVAPDTPVWQAGTLAENLERAGVSRRDFLGFCAKMAAIFAAAPPVIGTIARSASHAPTAHEIADRLLAITKPNVVWLQLQECTGCLESTMRSGATTIEDVILNLLSVNYVELLMAAAGEAASAALERTNREPHVLVVNGSVP